MMKKITAICALCATMTLCACQDGGNDEKAMALLAQATGHEPLATLFLCSEPLYDNQVHGNGPRSEPKRQLRHCSRLGLWYVSANSFVCSRIEYSVLT